MQADHLLASSGDGFSGGDSHFHAFRYDGSSYQLNTQRPFDGQVTDSAIGLDGDLAAVQLDRNTAQLVRFDGTAWTLAERFASRLEQRQGPGRQRRPGHRGRCTVPAARRQPDGHRLQHAALPRTTRRLPDLRSGDDERRRNARNRDRHLDRLPRAGRHDARGTRRRSMG
jgi:hypothetical protein